MFKISNFFGIYESGSDNNYEGKILELKKEDFNHSGSILDAVHYSNKDLIEKFLNKYPNTKKNIKYFLLMLILISKRNCDISTIYRYPKINIVLFLRSLLLDKEYTNQEREDFLKQQKNDFIDHNRKICILNINQYLENLDFLFADIYISINDYHFLNENDSYIIHLYIDKKEDEKKPSSLPDINLNLFKKKYSYKMQGTLLFVSLFIIEYFSRNIEKPSDKLMGELIKYYQNNKNNIDTFFFGSLRAKDLLLVEPENEEQQSCIPLPLGMTKEFYDNC